MRARILRPGKSATQSGMARTQDWVLEFAPASARALDPLMGWTSSEDTQRQVRLRFPTQEAAIEYARAHGLEYDLIAPHSRKPNIRSAGYGENFATNRRGAWTH
jgi:hypothetical protein